MSDLKSAVGVSFSGGLRGSVDATLVVGDLSGQAGVFVEISLPDINCVLEGKPGCISIFYDANFGIEIPSFIKILLADPRGIIESVDSLFETAERLTIGTRGVITKFNTPIVGKSIGNSIGAGSDNFIAQARRAVVGTLEDKLNSYTDDGSNTDTVADVIAAALNDFLGDDGINILKENITATYYEHVDILDEDGNSTGNFTTKANDKYDETLAIKSLMWTIPFGQKINIPLPG